MTDRVRRWGVVLLFAMFAAEPGSAFADIDVTVEAGRVSVHVFDASLRDVLDQIAIKTGMRVIYDGAPPQGRVEIMADDETPAAVVSRMLEGCGLPYAMTLDNAGTGVATLVISGVASRRAASPRASPPASPSVPAPAPPVSEIPILEDFELPENPPDAVIPESSDDRDPNAP